MEPKKALFVGLPEDLSYSEVHEYLKKFGKVLNFDDVKLRETPGYIVYGDVRKIFPPQLHDSGMFNCVFLLEQANHLSVPNEEFRVVLQIKSPKPLKELKVGSFLALFNPRSFTFNGRRLKCFSLGPEGVVVWFSKDPIPLSKTKKAKVLEVPASVAPSLKSLEVRSVKKISSSQEYLSRSQPLASTSFAHWASDGEDRSNMPPPTSWIDRRRNKKVLGPSIGHSTPLKTSLPTTRNDLNCNVCSKFAANRIEKNIIIVVILVNIKVAVVLRGGHKYPVVVIENLPITKAALITPVIVGAIVLVISKRLVLVDFLADFTASSHCCTGSHCGLNDNEKTDDYNKKSHENVSEAPEDGQWFIKEWVEQSTSRVGGKKPLLPENHYIESQAFTNRATCGSIEVEEAISDDDNFTSVSQVLPTAAPDPRPSTSAYPSPHPSKSEIAAGSDSESSSSDTSTLFLKSTKSHPAKNPTARKNSENHFSNRVDSIVFDGEIEDGHGMKADLLDKLPNSDLEQNNERRSSQKELVDDQGCSEPMTDMDVDTQKTCSQECPTPKILPIKRPGCISRNSSDSEEIPEICEKKKRKLFNFKTSDSSWYFDSARRYSDVPSRSETIRQSKTDSTDVEESSGSKNVDGSAELVDLDKCEGGNVEIEGENNQDSVTIIPPSDAEMESKSSGVPGCDVSSEKPSCKITFGSELPSSKLVEGIIEEWTSENSSSSAVKSAQIVVNPSNDLGDVHEAGPVALVENISRESIYKSDENITETQSFSRSQSGEKPCARDDLPCGDEPPTICSTRASLNSQFSPDDSIFTNKTLMEAEMSQTLCEPQERSSNVNEASDSSNAVESNNCGRNKVSNTGNSSDHVDQISLLEADMSQTLYEPQTHSSSVADARAKSINVAPTSPNISEVKSPTALPEPELSPDNDSNTSGKNRVSETENSSADVGPVTVEVPVTVHAEESSSNSNSPQENFRRQSPDSTTEGLSEELRLDEQPGRHSPASTVFYDAENDEDPPVENRPEDRDISERVLIPNQVFGVDGAIIDVAPHINEESMGLLVEAVCRLGCKSTFKHDVILGCSTISRACKLCATKSHYACPSCQESGIQKPLCWEFKFELHVLIGDKILRLEVAQQEAVKFLGIRAKEFTRKGRHAMETLQKIQELCCADPEEKFEGEQPTCGARRLNGTMSGMMALERLQVIRRHITPASLRLVPTTSELSKESDSFNYTLPSPLLSNEQRQFYEENGFLVIPKLIENELLDQCSCVPV
ncbi:hypothetical protein GE061_010340, partial [Apolygus lucorum]